MASTASSRSSRSWESGTHASGRRVRCRRAGRAFGPGGQSGIRRPSGRRKMSLPSGRRSMWKPPSCRSRWWVPHRWIRLSRSVAPPRAQCSMWWASRNRREPQPGNRQPLVAGAQRTSQGGRDAAALASDRERFAVAFEQAHDRGVARQPARGLGRQRRAVLELTAPALVDPGQGRGVDVHEHLMAVAAGASGGSGGQERVRDRHQRIRARLADGHARRSRGNVHDRFGSFGGRSHGNVAARSDNGVRRFRGNVPDRSARSAGVPAETSATRSS